MAERKRQADVVRTIGDVDRVIHEPSRLMIMMYLSSVESADYLFLMRTSGLTWGNLSSHLSKLEASGYVEITKTFVKKKPHTMVKLTLAGRKAIQAYGETMQSALRRIGR
jgi:DNA-binding MarR family transcriptional regulator